MKRILTIILVLCQFFAIAQLDDIQKIHDEGLSYYDVQDYYTAIDLFDKAIYVSGFESNQEKRIEVLDSDTFRELIASCFMGRGMSHFQMGDFKASQKDFWNTKMILPNDGLARFMQGRSYYNMKLYDLAWYAFNSAIDISDDDEQSYFFLSDCYYYRGLAIKSLITYSLNNELSNKFPNELNSDSVKTDFNTAIEYNNRNWKALQERGLLLMELEDFSGAMKDFDLSLSIVQDARTFRYRANLKLLQGNYRGAIEDCNESILIDPDYPTAYYTRGLALIGLYMVKEACLDFKKAVDLGFTEAQEDIKQKCK